MTSSHQTPDLSIGERIRDRRLCAAGVCGTPPAAPVRRTPPGAGSNGAGNRRSGNWPGRWRWPTRCGRPATTPGRPACCRTCGATCTAAEIAGVTNPALIPAGFRQVFFYADTARAYARLRGRERLAVRYLLTAERLAPQHMHTSAPARETTRALLARAQRKAGGSALRGPAARMQAG